MVGKSEDLKIWEGIKMVGKSEDLLEFASPKTGKNLRITQLVDEFA